MGKTEHESAVGPPASPDDVKLVQESAASGGGEYSEHQGIDADCERLLRNTKKQVKQMMEEAVTKKSIHEESCSIISLCANSIKQLDGSSRKNSTSIAVDACLTHGLKRRALGLFKTSSSTALIQKLAKSCESAQEVLDAVAAEEKRQKSQQVNQQQSNQSSSQQDSQITAKQKHATAQRLASSYSSIHKRNMWIKCALIEGKLVNIVEYLSENASKYYEADALISNYLCAQILSSLLVGPSALKFSRGKLYDSYRYEDPSANELIERHKLANPIACLCSASSFSSTDHQYFYSNNISPHKSTLNGKQPVKQHAQVGSDNKQPLESMSETLGDIPVTCTNSEVPSSQAQIVNDLTSGTIPASLTTRRGRATHRRPLALKGGVASGTLVTDCHHYSCQEISEHQQTRGYSLISSPENTSHCVSTGCYSSSSIAQQASLSGSGGRAQVVGGKKVSCERPKWSPRMLHETLHQNSRSRLLYAKNNVLLETQQVSNCWQKEQQQPQALPGYLSLHELSSDLFLKWIPNQMINGSGHASCCCTLGSAGEADDKLPASDSNVKEPQTPVAVESSYLELVVNLPLSRVVLLQCQFSGCNQHQQVTNELEKPANDDKYSSSSSSANELRDTLILVEADGVQGAPFKFPKGSLRLFLSCLESGLEPYRYLEPAIKFYNSNSTSDSHQQSQSVRYTMSSPPLGVVEGNSLATITSASDHSPISRLDSLLKRLPSLKRQNQSTKDAPTEPVQETTIDQAGTNQVAENFVYRIVSLEQPTWLPVTTPPHSAVSTTSLPPLTSTVSSDRAHRTQTTDQKFRWSLSRLAKFSSRYAKSESTNTTPSQQKTSSTFEQSTEGSLSVNTENENENENENTTTTECLLESNSRQGESTGKLDSSKELARIEAKLDYLKKSTSDDVLATLRTQSIQTLCESMRKQIVARAFYGWLAHCRKVRIIRIHLKKLIKTDTKLITTNNEHDEFSVNPMKAYRTGLTRQKWEKLMNKEDNSLLEGREEDEICCEINRLVYYGGIENNELRKEVWPYLLEHYSFTDKEDKRKEKDDSVRRSYQSSALDWIKIERVVKERDKELLAANMAKATREARRQLERNLLTANSNDDKNASLTTPAIDDGYGNKEQEVVGESKVITEDDQSNDNGDAEEEADDNNNQEIDSFDGQELEKIGNDVLDQVEDGGDESGEILDKVKSKEAYKLSAKKRRRRKARLESTGSVGSDASITDLFGNNIHRIDKDVQRCDRNFWYFKSTENLDKLRNIMCTYVWHHLDVGYVQGMCDLAAPFLVVFDDEVLAYTCFEQLMKRLVFNFPHGTAMDQHFESLKHLVQILDPKLFDILQSNGDYTHFYFCYRWLLLDFKRELAYEDVYRVWETIWAARFIVTDHFVVFMALAMVRYYRDIIIENNMDFTDTIKFFNEMAERHDTKLILALAQDCIVELLNLIET